MGREEFERMARELVEGWDFDGLATEVQSVEQVKNIQIEKLIEEMEKRVPQIVREALSCLKNQIQLNRGSAPLLEGFIQKMNPEAVLKNYAKNQTELPANESLYKFYDIEKKEFQEVLTLAEGLLNDKQYDEALQLFRLLTLLDTKNIECWMGKGACLFLLGGREKGPKTNGCHSCYTESLNCFWKAHQLEPANSAPAIGMIECLISLQRYHEAKSIIHEFAGKKLEDNLRKTLKMLNSIVSNKL